MKNMKSIYLKTVVAFFGLTTILNVSCTDEFGRYNTDKTQPTEDQLKGDNYILGGFFPQMQRNVISIQENDFQHCESMIGDAYSGYMTAINPWKGLVFSTYNPDNAWVSEPFNQIFSKFYSAYNSVKGRTKGEGVNFAWAKILRVASMQRMTDLYGPIPYSKIEEAGGMNAEYDSQEDVYKSMIADLTSAIDELTDYITRYPNAKPMADYDEVYGGDFTKWVRFANSLKLRLAVRMIYAAPDEAKKYALEAINHQGGLIQDNSQNAQIYCTKNPLNVMWDAYSDIRAGADLISYLKGYGDPRLTKYFQEGTVNNSTGYWGVRTGIEIKDKDKLKGYSAPRVAPTDPLLWMPACEVAFLMAECAINGWAVGETAEALYEKGVKLSFTQWGASGADNYLQDEAKRQAAYEDPLNMHGAAALNFVTIRWNESASKEQKLERIITQKWLAMYPLGQEAWSEYRRTGYPKLFPVKINSSNGTVNTAKGARRVNFPPDEYTNNTVNVQAAAKMLKGPDHMGTRLWWDNKE